MKRNEVKKPGNKTEMPRIKVTNSLTQLFNTLTSEGVIVQTALGPDGSFKVGRVGGLTVRSAEQKDCLSLAMHNLTFPKSDIELLKDKRYSRVQMTTSTKDDLEIWSELEASISTYFAYLLLFTICIVSFLAYSYLM
jgi:hypothetical protein